MKSQRAFYILWYICIKLILYENEVSAETQPDSSNDITSQVNNVNSILNEVKQDILKENILEEGWHRIENNWQAKLSVSAGPTEKEINCLELRSKEISFSDITTVQLQQFMEIINVTIIEYCSGASMIPYQIQGRSLCEINENTCVLASIIESNRQKLVEYTSQRLCSENLPTICIKRIESNLLETAYKENKQINEQSITLTMDMIDTTIEIEYDQNIISKWKTAESLIMQSRPQLIEKGENRENKLYTTINSVMNLLQNMVITQIQQITKKHQEKITQLEQIKDIHSQQISEIRPGGRIIMQKPSEDQIKNLEDLLTGQITERWNRHRAIISEITANTDLIKAELNTVKLKIDSCEEHNEIKKSIIELNNKIINIQHSQYTTPTTITSTIPTTTITSIDHYKAYINTLDTQNKIEQQRTTNHINNSIHNILAKLDIFSQKQETNEYQIDNIKQDISQLKINIQTQAIDIQQLQQYDLKMTNQTSTMQQNIIQNGQISLQQNSSDYQQIDDITNITTNIKSIESRLNTIIWDIETLQNQFNPILEYSTNTKLQINIQDGQIVELQNKVEKIQTDLEIQNNEISNIKSNNSNKIESDTMQNIQTTLAQVNNQIEYLNQQSASQLDDVENLENRLEIKISDIQNKISKGSEYAEVIFNDINEIRNEFKEWKSSINDDTQIEQIPISTWEFENIKSRVLTLENPKTKTECDCTKCPDCKLEKDEITSNILEIINKKQNRTESTNEQQESSQSIYERVKGYFSSKTSDNTAYIQSLEDKITQLEQKNVHNEQNNIDFMKNYEAHKKLIAKLSDELRMEFGKHLEDENNQNNVTSKDMILGTKSTQNIHAAFTRLRNLQSQLFKLKCIDCKQANLVKISLALYIMLEMSVGIMVLITLAYIWRKTQLLNDKIYTKNGNIAWKEISDELITKINQQKIQMKEIRDAMKYINQHSKRTLNNGNNINRRNNNKNIKFSTTSTEQ